MAPERYSGPFHSPFDTIMTTIAWRAMHDGVRLSAVVKGVEYRFTPAELVDDEPWWGESMTRCGARIHGEERVCYVTQVVSETDSLYVLEPIERRDDVTLADAPEFVECALGAVRMTAWGAN